MSERVVHELVGPEEPILPVAGVDQVVFTARGTAHGDGVAPDAVAQPDQERPGRALGQPFLRLLTCYHT